MKNIISFFCAEFTDECFGWIEDSSIDPFGKSQQKDRPLHADERCHTWRVASFVHAVRSLDGLWMVS